MGFFRFTGGLFKSMINVKGWVGYNDLKNHSTAIGRMVKTGFKPQQAAYQETFEEAMNRLNLSEADIQRMYSRYQLQFYLFIGGAILGALYTLHLFWNGHLFAGLLALILVCLMVFVGCAGSFYAFQIKQKKLGCTIQEWMDGKLSNEGENK